jgi:endogenous inhibitor of DNA gyrase (YacG/DUF329 family)
MKIIFGINVPYQSTKYDSEATEKKRHEIEARGEQFWYSKNRVFVPCIRYRDLFFELCDHCGQQVPKGRVSRGLTDCSPACHKIKTNGWYASTLKADREKVGERPAFFWWKFRDECFERDNYRCQTCGKDIRENIRFPGEAHHIVPISEGGSNKLENLRTLCYDCHKKEHSRIGKIIRTHKSLQSFEVPDA